MARLRLGYTKSRAGCLRCKQRRCDETRPCKACVRHGVQCSLVTPRSSDGSSSPTPPRQSAAPQSAPPALLPSFTPLPNRSRPIQQRPVQQRPASRNTQADDLAPSVSGSEPASSRASVSAASVSYSAAASPDPFPYFAKFITGQAQDHSENWVSDLELMHHFATSTAHTLLRTEVPEVGAGHIWQIEVPRLAFAHVFLLHQILATSAFHLAHLCPQQRQKYAVQASQHQSLAIQGVRAALANITPENCHALLAVSSLFFVGALAASRPDGHNNPTIDDLIDIFHLVKGIGGVLDTSEAVLRAGPLRHLFYTSGGSNLHRAVSLVTAELNALQPRIHAALADDPARPVIEAEALSFLACIGRSVMNSGSPEYRIIAAWPISMADEFIPLLRRRHQVALVLLAYYCAVMQATEVGYWFTQGWGLSGIQDIERLMVSPWDLDVARVKEWVTGGGDG
ncbi:hypothetical protein B0H67DRAFT_481487 [Lasiosphaeris hirsuta]|uniref:Zn(2)-C6 fungal-type domain-containing protein n=1 Tax=Lasiosphaeris hirsuta TaxID=260670 RepID=A0AA40AXZ4_9PEZI|nr:hypothetical protein B0H67DRAFT_481487 [Lasiosphaeris hirsuta]